MAALKVKEVKIDPEAQRSSQAELERVRADADLRRAALEQVSAMPGLVPCCCVAAAAASLLRGLCGSGSMSAGPTGQQGWQAPSVLRRRRQTSPNLHAVCL